MKPLLAALVAVVALSGCATVNQMAFNKGVQRIDTATKSIVLLTIDVSRPDGSRYAPNPFVVKVEKRNAKSKEDRQNFKINRDADTVIESDRTVYLARMALAPGQYILGDISGNANAFPFNSIFVVPLLLDFRVMPNSIAYLGRVTAQLRPRKEGEFRAGPVIPLIDQSVTGMSTGTWDVTVEDMSQKDVALFRATFPALASASIEIDPLPPFDRAAVQRLWDGQQTNEQNPAAARVPQTTKSK